VADPKVTGGQAGTEPTGTTVNATDGQTAGQSAAPDQKTGNGTKQDGESFFDYESIKGKPELEAAYKDMQRAFGQKTEAMSKGKDKIAQYDQFMKNPVDTMRTLAQQYGYQMVQGQLQDQNGKSKTFENWDQVMDEAERRVMEKMQPMFGEMQNMKKQSVEQALDSLHPDWRTYEDTMMENLQAHPTLVSNPDMLYRLSVPNTVLEAQANKRALAKIQDTTESGKVQGQSTTTQQAKKSPKKMTFDQAADFARQEVTRLGITRPKGE